MTRDDILNMPAGREMDAQIAQSVFGMRLTKNHGLAGGFYWVGNGVQFGIMQEQDTPAYSTDISAAWEVVEKMGNVDKLHDVELRTSIRGWICNIFNSFDSFEVNADTAPLAICRAALLAVMDGGQ